MSLRLDIRNGVPVVSILRRRGSSKLVAVASATAKSTSLADLEAARVEAEAKYALKKDPGGS